MRRDMEPKNLAKIVPDAILDEACKRASFGGDVVLVELLAEGVAEDGGYCNSTGLVSIGRESEVSEYVRERSVHMCPA
jgi:hypothetical protein